MNPATSGAGEKRALVRGADRNLENTIATHLFVVCPNNSGSTFLASALAACRAAWSFPREGQAIPGYAGPVTTSGPEFALWAAEPRRIALFADPGRHDWPRTRKAWYFFARARDPGASVFVEKSSQHVFQVGQLARHFRNPRFLFMVRNPYAVCEGICRNVRRRFGRDGLPRVSGPGRSLEETAAAHVVHCLARQRRNVEAHGIWPRASRGSVPEPRRDPPSSSIGGKPQGVFFTYEAMCAEPERIGREIRAMVPELDDLDLRRRLPVKGYDEMLTDMNARQIARLGTGQVAAFNRVFGEHRDLFDHFGYELFDAGAFRPEGASLPRERAAPGEGRASPREERVAPGRSG